MSIYRQQTKTFKSRLTTGVLLMLFALPLPLAEAFQIRQADSLRVMQSKPYAQSTSFRVNADMFIQPSAKINVDDTIAQPTPPVTGGGAGGSGVTSSGSSGGGGSSFGGSRRSSDWYLSRKYDELVREREEGDEPFLTSAPEDPSLKFDYVPTRPDAIETLENPVVIEAPSIVVPNVTTPIITAAPVVLSPQNKFSPAPVVAVNNPEAILVASPVSDEVTVVSLTKKQKKNLFKSQDNGFVWPWASKEDVRGFADEVEPWHASAPEQTTCIGCADVLWMSWCVFVALCLLLILIFVILIFALQIVMLRLKADRHKPDNPRTLKYRMKKLFQQFGLLSLCLVSLSLSAQAQTTTPQTLIYEGELLDDTGTPVLGSYTFRFSFWDNGDFEGTDVSAGALNVGAPDYLGWNEVQTVTTLSDGSFSMLLSEVTPFVPGMFDQDNVYLQVEVKATGAADTAYEFVDINLSDATDDRKIIASVPFAFNANKLDYKDLGFGADNIPYLDALGLLPNSVLPDITAADLDLADITLADFTNDLALTSGNIMVGDATNTAVGVAASGDVTLDNTGAFTIADDAVDGTDISLAGETLGDIMYFDGTDWTNLGIGTAGQVLRTNGAATAPEWGNAASGDLAGLNDTNITAPTAGNILTYDAVNGEWDNVAASGDVTVNETGVFDLADDAVEAAEIATDAVTDDAIDYANVTLADFTNDAGYLTADTLDGLSCSAGEVAKWNGTIWACGADDGGAAFTASDGITLTGSNFTNDFSTSIESNEITDGTITADDLNLTDITLSDFTNDAGFLTAESQDISLVGTDLSITGGSTLDLSSFGVDAQTLSLSGTEITISGGNTLDIASVDTDTTYTAGTGLTLTGTEFTSDLGTSIDASEIATNAVADDEIDYANVTLSDFTNDAGFLTTVDISDNTNLMAGAGITLTGDMITADLGSSVGVTEIELNAVGDAAIDYSAVTLADFTNDGGYLTSESQDLTLSGTDLSITGGSTVDLSVLSGATITTGVNGNSFSLDLDGDAPLTDTMSIVFGDNTGETVSWDGVDDRFEISDDLQIKGNLDTLGTINGVTVGLRNVTDVLSPRYPDSIFEADGTNNTGSMYEEEATTASGILDTVLRWFSRQTVLHDYDIVVQWTVPADFDSFQAPALSLDYQTGGLVADAVIDMTVERNNDGDDEITTAGIGLNSNTWTSTTFALDGTTTWVAGDTMKIRLKMQSKDSTSAQVGNIKINYVQN